MLQQVNYRAPKFIEWLSRNPNLRRVMHRKTLDMTKAARLLLVFSYATVLISLVIALLLIVLSSNLVLQGLGVVLLILTPYVGGFLLTAAVYTGHIFIAAPKEKQMMTESERIFSVHPAVKIGVAGSYGKTTFKEIINTVLSEKFKTAVTPGNMNTPIAHARFASKLDGDEEVLILEYGEEYPGDTKRFIATTKPDHAVLLGLAPNHLDYYKTLDALAADLLELRSLGSEKLLINGESALLAKYLDKNDIVVTSKQAGDWRISDISVELTGTSFVMTSKSQKLFLKSGLLGRHHVTPLAMAALLAHQLGLSKKQIEDGVAKTTAFEHRMQPRHISGATILDDTYNGNIEGILAGLELLKELNAKRKIYVTPGLVDQGEETEAVHHQIAKKLFDVKPDLIVLMRNSATAIIEDALAKLNYQGMVQIEEDPLNFYTNIDKVIAAGDLIMMQNDWTDNYN
ncbi:MAG: Mur ligase family protein [Candidatus Saccharimonadales bacterium]